jgi:NAD(P)-dependent dehydrogenase (short-subunit alcohol dehydrogenase family)
LGLALARRFGQGGAYVVLAGLDHEAGQRGVEVLRREGASVAFQPLDVRGPAQSRALVERMVAERSAIDVWVNNSGVANRGPAHALPREVWDQDLATVLSGAFYCAQAVGAHMLARGRGLIVKVASVSAFQAFAGGVADSTARAGLVMLT